MLAFLTFTLVTDDDVTNMNDEVAPTFFVTVLLPFYHVHQEILSDVNEDEKRNSWSHECF